MDGHGEAEDAEDDVRLPDDVGEGGRDEVRDGEVEDPVGRRRQAHALGPVLEREHLGAVDPPGGRPAESVDSHENVGARNHTLRGIPVDLPAQVSVAVYRVHRPAV